MVGNVVSVDGKKNRVAGRDYFEVTVRPESNSKEPLVRAQRRELKTLVDQVATECEVECFLIWRALHAHLGVHNIKGVTRDQFNASKEFLNAYRREHRDQQACRVLIDQIQHAARCKSMGSDNIDRFCTREFGQLGLPLLSRSELMRVLAFVDGYQPPPVSPLQLHFYDWLTRYPMRVVLLISVGIFLGRVF